MLDLIHRCHLQRVCAASMHCTLQAAPAVYSSSTYCHVVGRGTLTWQLALLGDNLRTCPLVYSLVPLQLAFVVCAMRNCFIGTDDAAWWNRSIAHLEPANNVPMWQALKVIKVVTFKESFVYLVSGPLMLAADQQVAYSLCVFCMTHAV